jgi:hypothetical protein
MLVRAKFITIEKDDLFPEMRLIIYTSWRVIDAGNLSFNTISSYN